MQIYNCLLKNKIKFFNLALSTIENHYGKILSIKKLKSLSNYCFLLNIKNNKPATPKELKLFLKVYNLNQITQKSDEIHITYELNKQHICPSILLDNFPEYTVMSYVDGKNPKRGYFNSNEKLDNLFHLIKKIHNKTNIKLTNNYIDPLTTTNVLLTKLKLSYEVEYLLKIIKYLSKELENVPPTISFNHNDLNTKNLIIDKNNKIWCIDFEYSGIGDVFFDLSSLKSLLNKTVYKKFLLKYRNELLPHISEEKFNIKLYFYNFLVLTTTVIWYLYMSKFYKNKYNFYNETFIKLFTKLHRDFEKHFVNNSCKVF